MPQSALRSFRALGALGVLLLLCVGCSQSGSTPLNLNLPAQVASAFQRNAPVDTRIVTANNQLGFGLLSELRKSDAEKNLFLSPASIALALQIAYNGAQGSTQTAMAEALNLVGVTVDDMNAMNAALQASLVSQDPALQLTIANSLWFREEAVRPSFVQINKDFYGAELGSMQGIPDTANAWVKEKTNGKIPSILPNQDYSNTIAIILNAVYFKGAWTSKFNPALTTDAPFHLTDGTQKNVRMMTQNGKFDVLDKPTFQAIRLPYGEGRMSMYVFLPKTTSTLTAFLGNLNATNWSAWLSNFQPGQGDVSLPRFKTEYSTSLKDALTALGMGIAFDPTGQADFSNLADNAYLQFVQHKTFVEVTEEGTEAAGATSIGVGITSAPTPFAFKADRPFFCAIRDDKTGTVLFMGAIVSP